MSNSTVSKTIKLVKSSQNLFVLSVASLFITVWATVSYLTYQNNLIKKHSSDFNNSNFPISPAIQNKSDDWRVYELVDDKVEIKLPQKLADLTCEEPRCERVSTKFSTGTTISSVSSPGSFAHQQWSDILPQLEEDKIVYTTKTINGKSTIYVKTNREIVPFLLNYRGYKIYTEGIVIRLNQEGDWVSFFIYKINPNTLESGFISDQEKSTFEQILTTLRFTD